MFSETNTARNTPRPTNLCDIRIDIDDDIRKLMDRPSFEELIEALPLASYLRQCATQTLPQATDVNCYATALDAVNSGGVVVATTSQHSSFGPVRAPAPASGTLPEGGHWVCRALLYWTDRRGENHSTQVRCPLVEFFTEHVREEFTSDRLQTVGAELGLGRVVEGRQLWVERSQGLMNRWGNQPPARLEDWPGYR